MDSLSTTTHEPASDVVSGNAEQPAGQRGASFSKLAVALGACAVVMTASAGGLWFERLRRLADRPASEVQVDPERLDFGTVWEQPAFRWTLPIQNVSARAMSVWQITADCGCTQVEPRELEIAPGAIREIGLTVDLTRRDSKPDDALHPFSVNVFPRIAHRMSGQPVWTIRGQVRRNPIVVEQNRVDYGKGLVAGEVFSERTLSVTLKGVNGAWPIHADCRPPESGVVALRALHDQPGEFELRLRPAAALAPGMFSFVVRVEADTGDGAAGPFRDIFVSGTVEHDLGSEPARLLFGAAMVGSQKSDFVVLSSRLRRRFAVERINGGDAGLSAVESSSLSSEPGISVYEVRQRIERVGAQAGRLRFHLRYDDGAKESTVLAVETSYEGLPREPEPAARSAAVD